MFFEIFFLILQNKKHPIEYNLINLKKKEKWIHLIELNRSGKCLKPLAIRVSTCKTSLIYWSAKKNNLTLLIPSFIGWLSVSTLKKYFSYMKIGGITLFSTKKVRKAVDLTLLWQQMYENIEIKFYKNIKYIIIINQTLKIIKILSKIVFFTKFYKTSKQ